MFTQKLLSQKSIHVERYDIDLNDESAVKVDFATNSTGTKSYGLHVDGIPLTSSQTNAIGGILATVASDFSSQRGSVHSRLAYCKTYNGDSDYRGAEGIVSVSSLSNSNSLYTEVLGGDFIVKAEPLTLSGSKFWIAGARAYLLGSFNDTPNTGAITALLAVDENQGTAKSWAGYFLGKSYLSDKTIIGTTTIPSMASTFDVSNFNLFVTGGILTEECLIVTQDQWADYVFEKDYQLQPLAEVEQYIENNGHLPNIPAGEVLDKNGIPMAKITILQQEKIEELFLHREQEKNKFTNFLFFCIKKR